MDRDENAVATGREQPADHNCAGDVLACQPQRAE